MKDPHGRLPLQRARDTLMLWNLPQAWLRSDNHRHVQAEENMKKTLFAACVVMVAAGATCGALDDPKPVTPKRDATQATAIQDQANTATDEKEAAALAEIAAPPRLTFCGL
jgi:hypothetical protein